LVCGRVIEEAILHFKEDDFVCRVCDPLTPRGVTVPQSVQQKVKKVAALTTVAAPSKKVAVSTKVVASKKVAALTTAPSKKVAASTTAPSKKVTASTTAPSKKVAASSTTVTTPSKKVAASTKVAASKKVAASTTVVAPSKEVAASSIKVPATTEAASSKAPASTEAASSKAPASTEASSIKAPASTEAASSKAPASTEASSTKALASTYDNGGDLLNELIVTGDAELLECFTGGVGADSMLHFDDKDSESGTGGMEKEDDKDSFDKDNGDELQKTRSATAASQISRKTHPKSTFRKSKENQRVKIGLRKRVKMRRFQLFHCLSTDQQRACIPKNVPNNYTFFGTVFSRGTGKSSWNVKFDVLPADDNVVSNITRGKLEVVQPGEEEQPLNARDLANFVEHSCDPTEEALGSPEKRLDNPFYKLPVAELKVVDMFQYSWGTNPDQYIQWQVIPDAVWLEDSNDPLHSPEQLEFHEPNIQSSELDDAGHIFFQYIFPNIVGEFHVLANVYVICLIRVLICNVLFFFLTQRTC